MLLTPALSTTAFQPEQVVLPGQLTCTGTPEVIQLAGQLRADAQLAPLLQKPFDIGCNITRKPALLKRSRQPSGEKEVFLCRRENATILSGQRKCHQGAPCKMARFICQRQAGLLPVSKFVIRDSWRRY